MRRNRPSSRRARLLAWLAVALVAGFIVLGALLYGFSPEVQERAWRDIAERPGGPMTFRFVLQPLMAAAAAIRDGMRDARLGRTPYFWTVLSNAQERGGRLGEGLIATSRIILLGLLVDVIYQRLVLGTFYPGEAVIVALTLALLPYFLLRGPAARIAQAWRRVRAGRAGKGGEASWRQ